MFKRMLTGILAVSFLMGAVDRAIAGKPQANSRFQLVRMESAYGGHRAAYRAWRFSPVRVYKRGQQLRVRLQNRVIRAQRSFLAHRRPRASILRIVRRRAGS